MSRRVSDSSTTATVRGALRASDAFWPWFYAALALAACSVVGPLDVPLVADNQHYFFISERFASGVPPHISHFDPKNALSMMLSGGAIAIGRTFGVADIYSARLLSVMIIAACYGLLWIVAHRYTQSRITAHVAALAAFVFNRFVIMGVVGARPKVFLVFFVLLALLAVQARRPIWAGLVSAAAFLCWQPALLFTGLAPLALIFWARPLRSMMLFALGFLVLFVSYEAYFVYHGAFWEQIEQAYRFPSQYMSGVELRLQPMFTRFQWMTKTKEALSLRSVVPSTGVAFIVGAIAWGAIRPRRALALLRERPEWAYMLGTGGAALVFLHLDYQGFPDRFIIEPLLAIGFAMVACLPLRLLRDNARGTWLAFAPVVFAGGLLAATMPQLEYAEYRGSVLPTQLKIGGRVAALAADGKTIWAVGCTHLLAFAHLDNWQPYGFFFRGMDRYMGDRFGRPYVPWRDGELPDIVLLSRGKLEGLPHWLPQYYERDPSEALFASSVVFWRKRDVPGDEGADQTYRSLRTPARRLPPATVVDPSTN